MHNQNLAIDHETRENYANEIFNTIEEAVIFKNAKTIALFASLPDEVPTTAAIERWSNERRIVLPRVGENSIMEFFDYTPSQMCYGSYGINEPQGTTPIRVEHIDLMIVPGVAFTTSGGRLGRGKGYYDRYLSRSGFKAYTIGICYPHQIVESLPLEEHDVILDRVISQHP